MSARRGGRSVTWTALLVGALVTTQLACLDPQTCDARGTSTSVTGLVSYAVGTGAGSTMNAGIEVFDYKKACWYDGEAFPMKIGDCELWVDLDHGAEAPASYRGVGIFPGNPDAWASLGGGQTCTLPLLGGKATVTFSGGTLAFSTQTTVLFLSGTVSQWTEGQGPTGELQWQFEGGGWPQ